ncbi:MAG: hypothetical protein AAFY56_01645 [Pseudomonadota bacterium]
MERWRRDDPCAHVKELAKSIESGVWLNLLVADLDAAADFQSMVLEADIVYRDERFAIMQHGRSFWMLHADSTYDGHPMAEAIHAGRSRGAGCEIRVQGCDPDMAEARARDRKFTVLAAAQDKPHGLREAYLCDPDGYVWVPSVITS